MDHMLKGGTITSEQRQAYDRGAAIKVSLRDFAIVLYRLCEARGYVERGQGSRINRDEVIASCSHNMVKEFGIYPLEMEHLLYYIDDYILDSDDGQT